MAFAMADFGPAPAVMGPDFAAVIMAPATPAAMTVVAAVVMAGMDAMTVAIEAEVEFAAGRRCGGRQGETTDDGGGGECDCGFLKHGCSPWVRCWSVSLMSLVSLFDHHGRQFRTARLNRF